MNSLESWWRELSRGKWREKFAHVDLATFQGAPFLVAGGAVGFLAVLYSGLFSGAILTAQTLVHAYPYVFLVTAPLCLVCAYWVVWRFAPAAGGSGVPQVMAALESPNPFAGEAISLRVAGIGMLSSLIALLGAGGLGREGPMILIASCVFAAIGRQARRWWPDIHPRSWLVAGAAAGVAAAFQTPLAGVIFVLEELAHEHYHEFKTYVLSAVVVAGMIAQWLFGRYLFLGYAKIGTVPVSSVFWAVLAGAVCGLTAICFEWAMRTGRERLARYAGAGGIWIAFGLGVALALLALYDSRSVGGGISLIQDLLFHDEPSGWRLVALRFFAPILTHLSGVTGGFLAPALSLGASLGAWLGQIAVPEHRNLLAMCGMVGFLGAINRAPFTAMVIVMEMTDSHSAIFPLMVSAVVAYSLVNLHEKKLNARAAVDAASIPPAGS